MIRTYVRWHRNADRLGRVFPPLDPEHCAARALCRVCAEPLGNGQRVQLLAIGPEPEDRAACRDGAWVSAVALLFHAACLGSEE